MSNSFYPDKIPGTDIEIVDNLGELSSNSIKKTCKDVNLIEMPDGTVRIDIREWNEAHTKASYGILLNEDEAQELVDILFDQDIVPSTVKPFLFQEDDPDCPDYPKENDDEIPGQMSLFD